MPSDPGQPKPVTKPSWRKPLGYDTRADGTDYRVCPRCASRKMFSGSERYPFYRIHYGDLDNCEICDKPLG
jgi:hypothetical protein